MMVSDLRLQNCLVLGIILLFTKILYCTSTDDAIAKAIQAITPVCVFDTHSVSFFLYSKDDPYGVDIGKDIDCDKKNLSSIQPNQPILITVHGFTSTGNNTNMYGIIREWINVTKNTAISLDWSIPACHTNISLVTNNLAYGQAVKNVRVVAKGLAESLIKMNQTCGVPFEMINIVGHSLGAHVAGFAGKNVQAMTDAIVHKIIGLDPAGPLFDTVGLDGRLSKYDAEEVIVVHTSILGIPKYIGHTDICVNGAVIQPGCEDLTNWISCSHSFSLKVMRDSLRPDCSLLATPCSSCLSSRHTYSSYPESNCTNDTCYEFNIGTCTYNAKGVMCLKTTKKHPYCKAHSKEIKNCTLL